MCEYKIRGNAFKLRKSNLADRTQYVGYESKQSETLLIKCAVPQSSMIIDLLSLSVFWMTLETYQFVCVQFYLQMIQVYS